jgi:hypothetical protein
VRKVLVQESCVSIGYDSQTFQESPSAFAISKACRHSPDGDLRSFRDGPEMLFAICITRARLHQTGQACGRRFKRTTMCRMMPRQPRCGSFRRSSATSRPRRQARWLPLHKLLAMRIFYHMEAQGHRLKGLRVMFWGLGAPEKLKH